MEDGTLQGSDGRALTLYLDLTDLFLFILRFFDDRH